MKALRGLFPYNNITHKGPAELIRLHLSTKTARPYTEPYHICRKQSMSRAKLGRFKMAQTFIDETSNILHIRRRRNVAPCKPLLSWIGFFTLS